LATFGDLKQRIISETTRDDLADDLSAQFSNIIAKSIEQYANERWWFNEARLVVPTVPGVETVAWPPGARWIDGLYLEINAGNSQWPIQVRSIDEFEALSQPMTLGQPTDYLVATDPVGAPVVKLYPIPNAVYSLAFDLIRDVSPPLVADTDQNFWTNQGQDLIAAQAKIRLYRDFLSAVATDQRLVLARGQEQDAYSRLRAESTRRTATGRLQPAW
jgi:hypothetical protein